MKKSLIAIMLSFVCLSVFAQDRSIKSGILGGVTLDWFKDQPVDRNGYSIPDLKPSFLIGYQFQIELKHRLSLDAALLYGQKRGEIASLGYELAPIDGLKTTFARNYLALNGVINYNLTRGLKVGLGVEPTFLFSDRILVENKIKSAFDIPIVVKAAYSFRYFDLALTYKHGTCNVVEGVPRLKSGRSRDLQLSVFIPIFR